MVPVVHDGKLRPPGRALAVKVGVLKARVTEAPLHGCVMLIPRKAHADKLRRTHTIPFSFDASMGGK